VLVIEATLPNSRETNHGAWEHLVTSQRYRYVWFDGLNRYYVAEEHPELVQHFGIQPNVFDNYISWHLDRAWEANRAAVSSLKDVRAALVESERHADAVRGELHDMMRFAEHLEMEKQDALDRIARLSDELTLAHANNQQVAAWANDLEQRLVATLNSTSWKVTRPLRYAGRVWIQLRRPGLAKRVLLRATRSQLLRRAVIPVLLRYPPLGRHVSGMLQTARQAVTPEAPQAVHVPQELRHLPVSVRGVLADLQRARGR
jgi:hypothetical protein